MALRPLLNDFFVHSQQRLSDYLVFLNFFLRKCFNITNFVEVTIN